MDKNVKIEVATKKSKAMLQAKELAFDLYNDVVASGISRSEAKELYDSLMKTWREKAVKLDDLFYSIGKGVKDWKPLLSKEEYKKFSGKY